MTNPDGLTPVPEIDPLERHPLHTQIEEVRTLHRKCSRHLDDLDQHSSRTEAQEWLIEWAHIGAYGFGLWWMWRSDTAESAIEALQAHRDATAATDRDSAHQGEWIEAIDQVLDVLRGAS